MKRFLKKGAREIAKMLPMTDSRGEGWTHHWVIDGSFSRIDYIFASVPMLSAVVPGSARVADSARAGEASDHRPVEVILDTNRMEAGN